MVKKSILRRIKWDNVVVAFTWIVAIICIGYMCYSTKSYAVTTTGGLVRILEDNKISNPSAVQAGQTIYIYLERKQ